LERQERAAQSRVVAAIVRHFTGSSPRPATLDSMDTANIAAAIAREGQRAYVFGADLNRAVARKDPNLYAHTIAGGSVFHVVFGCRTTIEYIFSIGTAGRSQDSMDPYHLALTHFIGVTPQGLRYLGQATEEQVARAREELGLRAELDTMAADFALQRLPVLREACRLLQGRAAGRENALALLKLVDQDLAEIAGSDLDNPDTRTASANTLQQLTAKLGALATLLRTSLDAIWTEAARRAQRAQHGRPGQGR